MTAEELAEYIGESMPTDDDGDEVNPPAETVSEWRAEALQQLEESADDELREFCDEHGIDPEQNEALEHWAVSDWFAKKLAEHGEMTGELFNIRIWGRCCSGQAISADGVIAEIAASMQILDGQRHSWAE
jgi:hypothetical protein